MSHVVLGLDLAKLTTGWCLCRRDFPVLGEVEYLASGILVTEKENTRFLFDAVADLQVQLDRVFVKVKEEYLQPDDTFCVVVESPVTGHTASETLAVVYQGVLSYLNEIGVNTFTVTPIGLKSLIAGFIPKEEKVKYSSILNKDQVAVVYNEYTQKLNPYFPAYIDLKSGDEVDALYLALYGILFQVSDWSEGRMLYPWAEEVGKEVSSQFEWFREKYSYTGGELYIRVLEKYASKKVDSSWGFGFVPSGTENSPVLRMPTNLVGVSQGCLSKVVSNMQGNDYPGYVSKGVLPFYNLRMLGYLLRNADTCLPGNPLVENKKLTQIGTQVCTLLKLKPRKFLEYLCAPAEQSSSTGRKHQSVLRLNTRGELYVYSKYPCKD